jgi:hypothetical protein
LAGKGIGTINSYECYALDIPYIIVKYSFPSFAENSHPAVPLGIVVATDTPLLRCLQLKYAFPPVTKCLWL